MNPVHPPIDRHDGIATSTLGDAGMDEAIIADLVDGMRNGFYPDRHSLLIYRNHTLVLEDYFAGRDGDWGRDLGIVNHNDATLHDLRSISKSVTSACIGLAIRQGSIKSVDQPIFDFLLDYSRYCNEGREKLTIRHLLTMSSGLEWDEERLDIMNDENKMDFSDDPIGFALNRKIVAAPGTLWRYNSGSTEILGAVLWKATGKDLNEFARENLFEPMGIAGACWNRFPRYNAPLAACGLRMTSRELLKFGILYLDDGQWEGKQILPKKWVEESLTMAIKRPDEGGYGYFFWIIEFDVDDSKIVIHGAAGNGDQRMFIDKKNDMIIVTTAGLYNNSGVPNSSPAIRKRIYQSFSFQPTG
jgi:CubicO group peptidase (beta-lactamase class C family)